MKLHILGTAAAEGVPAVFCSCAHCRYAREARGHEIRTRAGALLDGTLKLDFGPDSYMQSLRDGVNYALVHSVLITHTHSDHLTVSELGWRWGVFAHVPAGDKPLTVYGNENLGTMLDGLLGDRIAYQRLTAFQTVDIEGYAVTPLQAVHCVSNGPDAGWPIVVGGKTVTRVEDAFIYLIEKDGKRLLYAHDTGPLTDADWEYLRGKRLDLVSLDCTNGRLDRTYYGHMGCHDDLAIRERLISIGAADDKTTFVANHFSHNGLLPYDELCAMMPGFIVARDGMDIEI